MKTWNRWTALIVLFAAFTVLLFAGCGKVRQVKQMAESVQAIAETGEELAGSVMSDDEIDWDNVDLSERDVRKFYEGVVALEEEYPDINFEVSMTASMEAVAEGVDFKKAVEKETDMSFDEYNRLSTTLMFVMMQAVDIEMTRAALEAMEDGMAQYEDIDESALTEEQKQAIENQKSDLADARAELEDSESRKHWETVDMVVSIREEMGL